MVISSLAAGAISSNGVSNILSGIGTQNGPSGFAETLSNVASQALKAVPNAEKTATQGIVGNVPSQKVVMSILEAERTLQTVVALREKAVSAYQEISRMTI